MNNIPHAVDLSAMPQVTAFFDPLTSTVSYVVKDPSAAACAVIDSVMDIDYSGTQENTRGQREHKGSGL